MTARALEMFFGVWRQPRTHVGHLHGEGMLLEHASIEFHDEYLFPWLFLFLSQSTIRGRGTMSIPLCEDIILVFTFPFYALKRCSCISRRCLPSRSPTGPSFRPSEKSPKTGEYPSSRPESRFVILSGGGNSEP